MLAIHDGEVLSWGRGGYGAFELDKLPQAFELLSHLCVLTPSLSLLTIQAML